MRVQNAVAFFPAELDCRIHDLPGQAGVPVRVADGQSFELGEIGEVSNAHAADRLVPLVANQMRCRKVVAVELFLERTMLLADIDGAADRDHPGHFFHRANDPHGYRIPAPETWAAGTSCDRSSICRCGAITPS